MPPRAIRSNAGRGSLADRASTVMSCTPRPVRDLCVSLAEAHGTVGSAGLTSTAIRWIPGLISRSKFEPLAVKFESAGRGHGDIAARPGKTGDQADLFRVARDRADDRYVLRQPFGYQRRGLEMGERHVGLARQQLYDHRLAATRVSTRVAMQLLDTACLAASTSRSRASNGTGSNADRPSSRQTGHAKTDKRMDRCWLQGALGDALHALSCAADYNIRWLMRAIVRLAAKRSLLAPIGLVLYARISVVRLARALADALGWLHNATGQLAGMRWLPFGASARLGCAGN